jgi:hypothetical protein
MCVYVCVCLCVSLMQDWVTIWLKDEQQPGDLMNLEVCWAV